MVFRPSSQRLNVAVESLSVGLVDDRYGHHIKVLAARLQVSLPRSFTFAKGNARQSASSGSTHNHTRLGPGSSDLQPFPGTMFACDLVARVHAGMRGCPVMAEAGTACVAGSGREVRSGLPTRGHAHRDPGHGQDGTGHHVPQQRNRCHRCARSTSMSVSGMPSA